MNEDCARSLKYLKVRGQKAPDCNLLCACLCIFQTNMLLEEARSRQRSVTAQATPPQTEVGDTFCPWLTGSLPKFQVFSRDPAVLTFI